MSSIFRNSKREDMYVQAKTIDEHFKILRIIQKVLIEVVSLMNNEHYKEALVI